MKIDPNQEILKSAYTDKTIRPDKPANNEFGTMLKDAIRKEPSKESSENVKPLMITSIPNIQTNPLFAVQDSPIVEQTENFLDILEEYRNKLLDPQTTLRPLNFKKNGQNGPSGENLTRFVRKFQFPAKVLLSHFSPI